MSHTRRAGSTARRVAVVALGAAFIVLMLAAVLAVPIPPLPSRTNMHLDEFVRDFFEDCRAWSAHDGWRYSYSSWIYLAVAAPVATALMTTAGLFRGLGTRWRWVLWTLPPAVIVAFAPLVQDALGLDASNYGVTAGDSLAWAPWWVPGPLVVWGIAALASGKVIRRSPVRRKRRNGSAS
jgi:hypothetical protein